MDSISNIISNRADDLFKTPPSPLRCAGQVPSLPVAGFIHRTSLQNAAQRSPEQVPDLIIDLEAPPDPQISYTSADDILFEEDVLINLPILPEIPKSPSIEKITALKIMIQSMRDQLDAMLRIINEK